LGTRSKSAKTGTVSSEIITSEPTRNADSELLKRGIKTRVVTGITEKNIAYCKELMKIVYELRHLEGVKGNCDVSESDYIATPKQQEGERPFLG
jgi:two-component system, OmpR family, sensor histidine kinase VicK